MTNEGLLKAWDAGEEITTVEMGGMSDAYEMAIQLIGMEWLRYLMEIRAELPAGKQWDAWDDKVIEERIKPLGLQDNYGLSGAQWGAAANLGSVFYKQGYEPGLASAGTDRHIKIRKTPFEQRPE